MDIQYLEYILVLAETGNMTRAAKKLYISQPTLSQFLSKQEAELGTPLFQRSNGIYNLTPVGQLYAEYARKVLALTDELNKGVQHCSNIQSIRLGTSASRAMQMLTSVLADFRRDYPRMELIMTEDSFLSMTNAITKGEIDIAFVTAPSLTQYKGNSIELKKEEVVFAVPTSHPYCQSLGLNSSHSLTSYQLVEIFTNTPFILQHKGSCIRYLFDSIFDKLSFYPPLACCTSHAQSICDMVSSNIGVGFIPVKYAVDSPLVTYFSMEPKIYRIHSILYRKDLIMEAPHRYLIELAKQYADTNWANSPK